LKAKITKLFSHHQAADHIGRWINQIFPMG